MVINPNGRFYYIYALYFLTWLIFNKGATNYKGNIVYMAEGRGSNVPSALVVMNPVEPYNTSGKFSL